MPQNPKSPTRHFLKSRLVSPLTSCCFVSLGIAKEMHPGPGPSKLCFRNHSGQCAVIISTTMTGLTVSLMACFRKPWVAHSMSWYQVMERREGNLPPYFYLNRCGTLSAALLTSSDDLSWMKCCFYIRENCKGSLLGFKPLA